MKGKYDDALRGDWAIEKLTRYIDKNMPDDAPDKCVGPDGKVVDDFECSPARTCYVQL